MMCLWAFIMFSMFSGYAQPAPSQQISIDKRLLEVALQGNCRAKCMDGMIRSVCLGVLAILNSVISVERTPANGVGLATPLSVSPWGRPGGFLGGP